LLFGDFRLKSDIERILNNPRLLVESKLYKIEQTLKEQKGENL